MSGEFNFERFATGGNCYDSQLSLNPEKETLRINLKFQIAELLQAILTCNEIGQVIYHDELILKKNINNLYHQLIISLARRDSLE